MTEHYEICFNSVCCKRVSESQPDVKVEPEKGKYTPVHACKHSPVMVMQVFAGF